MCLFKRATKPFIVFSNKKEVPLTPQTLVLFSFCQVFLFWGNSSSNNTSNRKVGVIYSMEVLEKELKETEETKKLTPKQERFCKEYVLCLNKAKAYSIAYGLPYETNEDMRKCGSMGCRLYENARINARIKELVAEANKECNVSLAYLVKEQIEQFERMKKGKKEKKIDFEGNVVDTGEIEYDNKAINGALKNLADFTGLSKQVLEARISGKQEVTINKVDMLAETLFNGDDS